MQKLEVSSDSEKLKAGYQKVMLRQPNQQKVISLENLYEDALEQYGPDGQPEAFTLVANALLNLDEFINK